MVKSSLWSDPTCAATDRLPPLSDARRCWTLLPRPCPFRAFLSDPGASSFARLLNSVPEPPTRRRHAGVVVERPPQPLPMFVRGPCDLKRADGLGNFRAARDVHVTFPPGDDAIAVRVEYRLGRVRWLLRERPGRLLRIHWRTVPHPR